MGKRDTLALGTTIAALAAAISLLAASLILSTFDFKGPARIGIAVLPAPVVALWFFFFWRLLRSQDELLQRIQLEALAIAFPLGFLGVTTMGLIIKAGVDTPFEFIDAAFFMVMGYALGLWIARNRYL